MHQKSMLAVSEESCYLEPENLRTSGLYHSVKIIRQQVRNALRDPPRFQAMWKWPGGNMFEYHYPTWPVYTRQ
jgi:hypothetical protein